MNYSIVDADKLPLDEFDYVIVGGGIIGLAVARQIAIAKRGNASIVILERETTFGMQTSSRNSEVIHAGIYYPAGSEKAKLCIRGRDLLYQYCEAHNVPYSRIGKLIVAQKSQLTELESVQTRARKNGVDDLELIDRERLHEMEPAVRGEAALFSPSTGIVDSHALMRSLLNDAERANVIFSGNTTLESVHQLADEGYVLSTRIIEQGQHTNYSMKARFVINCAGLGAQEVAQMFNNEAGETIFAVPKLMMSKGCYFDYSAPNPFQRLIYPLPDTSNDALGVHATCDLAGYLRFGPDAEPCDAIDYLVADDKRDVFAASIKEYFPSLDAGKLMPAYAGIRSKVFSLDGVPSDFVIRREEKVPRLINLFGIDSPGLTSCLAIAASVETLMRQDGSL